MLRNAAMHSRPIKPKNQQKTPSARDSRFPAPVATSMSQELSQRAAAALPLLNSPIPHHLLCNSCSKPLVNGFQTPHGCRLCQSCVTNLLPAAAADRRRCPGNTEACRDEQEEILVSQASCFADMATRRELSRVRVLCLNSPAGCRWIGGWGQVDAHPESCQFQSRDCELCHQQVMRSNMQRHLTEQCEQRHWQLRSPAHNAPAAVPRTAQMEAAERAGQPAGSVVDGAATHLAEPVLRTPVPIDASVTSLPHLLI